MPKTDIDLLNDELAGASALHIQILTGAELDVVAGGYSADQAIACTNGTRSICHVDGTDDGD